MPADPRTGIVTTLGAFVPRGGFASTPLDEALYWSPCLTWASGDDGQAVVGVPHCWYVRSTWGDGGLLCPECIVGRGSKSVP